jgi:hypothetical protein
MLDFLAAHVGISQHTASQLFTIYAVLIAGVSILLIWRSLAALHNDPPAAPGGDSRPLASPSGSTAPRSDGLLHDADSFEYAQQAMQRRVARCAALSRGDASRSKSARAPVQFPELIRKEVLRASFALPGNRFSPDDDQ